MCLWFAKLAGSGACGGYAETEYNVVETAFQSLQQEFTGNASGGSSLVEEIAELLFEYAISVLCLLLFSEHDTVFGCLAATAVAVLAWRKLRFASTLSGPKMASPNLRAIRDLGPIYLAIIFV